MLTSLYLGVKANQYFVCSRCIFLDTKNMFKIWLNPVLSPGRGGGGGYSLIWPIKGCVTGQGMVFVLFVLKQGI